MKSRRENDCIDPIGLELILKVLSTGASILGVVFQFRSQIKKSGGPRNELQALRRQLLRLHNSLDDIILIIQRHDHQQERNRVASSRVTPSGTVMSLAARDYLRWIDIDNEVHKLSQETFSIISEIRKSFFAQETFEISDKLDSKLFASFDELFINWGNYTVGEFVGKFRNALSDLDSALIEIIESTRK